MSIERVSDSLNALGREIGGACAGSTEGQFPILDLFGNLRDELESEPASAQFADVARQAWEMMVGIVTSGTPFTPQQIEWLHQTFAALNTHGAAISAAAVVDASAAATVLTPPTSSPPAEPASIATPSETPLVLDLAGDGELLREFINESHEHLDNIEQGVLGLEDRPDDKEMLDMVFRAFHSFKGGAGFLGLLPINQLAHVLESLLAAIRHGRLVIDSGIIELILNGRDTLKRFTDEMDAQLNSRKPPAPCLIPTEALKARVRAVLDGPAGGASTTPSLPPAGLESELAPAYSLHAASPASSDRLAAEARPALEPSALCAAEANPAASFSGNSPTSATVKVDTKKLDSLIDLVGELVIAQSLVTQDAGRLTEASPQFTRNLEQLGRIARELQLVSMSLRMVPIRGVFQKMARLVRDLATTLGKEVKLLTSGEDTELDRNMVEELSDPLMHMIRNAIDHGIESAEARIVQGKPASGTITLRAYHQAGNIILEIEDDGAGLNKERIFAKAVEKGMVGADARLSDEEICEFLFDAGFSTADKVTNVSGRGVGMDVVRRNVERLRGRVNISSTAGQGTLFRLRLPLTLAIIDGLIVKVGQERYILPTLSVRESFRPRREMLSTVHERGELVNVRGRLIPLLRLYDWFGVQPESTDPTEGIVVVVQVGSALRGLLVDGLSHKQEVVIKNLGELVRQKNPALAGAAILGDGRVGLILDANALVNLPAQELPKAAAA